MISQEYCTNRPRFPDDELAKYRGQWVAFSPDGLSIVANAFTLGQLEERLQAAGVDPQRVVLEGVPGEDEDTLLSTAATQNPQVPLPK